MIDVDFFKAINDTHGHLGGDEALRQIAKLIGVTLRNYDVVFRYGGDEFVICLPDVDKSKAFAIVNRLFRCIEEHFAQAAEWKQAVTVSVGIASYPADARTLSALVGEADCAMYQAKRAGRNRASGAPVLIN